MSTSPASTELNEPISDNTPDSGKGEPCEKNKILLPGATWDLHSGTPELTANFRVSSESKSFSDYNIIERLSSQATSSRGRFQLYGSTAEPAPNIVRSIEQTAVAVGCDSESSPLKSTSEINECSSPWFSPETKTKMDEEWEEFCPTYKLNVLQSEPDELPDESAAEPACKKRRTEPWVGLPPEAFLGFSSSLGARASMALTGSSAFAMGAACKQALFGGLEKDLLMARFSEQLPMDIRLVTKAALNRIARIPGMQIIGGEESTPGEANLLIQTRMNQQEFYIGISERPVERFCDHQRSGYTEMHVMVFPDSRASGNMEKNLIVAWQKHPHCMNAGPGGLGASEGRPHFCYVVFRPPALKR